MDFSLDRRQFLTGSAAAAAAAGLGAARPARGQARPPQEFYELRIYRPVDGDDLEVVRDYLAQALIPALERLEVDRVGVFSQIEVEGKETDGSMMVLIPYRSLDLLAQLSVRLAADGKYQKAAAPYFARPRKNPAYRRIESRLMKAFAGMPVLELPAESAARKPRIFELRIYESHNEEMAFRKVDMFNSGEIDVMREVKLGPVFFGETLISSDVPNLTYMLSAADMDAHRKHWDAFRVHPEWDRMKRLEKYRGAVSKITNFFLAPAACSRI